jgi:hypothetical protein
VTLVLLKGPETNAVPDGVIIEKYPNTGTYSWTPSADLEPSKGGTGYGIQLIVDETGQYQYTTQFGISNDNWSGHSGSPSAYGGSSSAAPSSLVVSSGYAAPTGGYPHGGNSTMAHPTGWMPHNTTKIQPTGHHTKPTLYTSSSIAAPSSVSPPAPSVPVQTAEPTGAASTLATSFAGLVLAAGVAVLAF